MSTGSTVQVDAYSLMARRVRAETWAEAVQLAHDIADNAQDRAAEDEGDLKRSKVVIPDEAKGEVIAGFTAPHSVFVEYGTGDRGSSSLHPEPEDGGDLDYTQGWPGMAAQPFLTPASEEARKRAAERMAGAVRRGATGGSQ